MKKLVFYLVAAFSLFLISCSSTEEPEQVSIDTIKSGVVHRVFQRDHRASTDFSVRLMDGTIIAGYTIDNSRISQSQSEDFFFAQPGDTIVYCGEKVLEVRFKD